MSIPTCATCRFWCATAPRNAIATRNMQADPSVGTCQANPPVVVISNAQAPAFSAFPETISSRFCGRWAPRDNPSGDGERENVVDLRSVA